MNPKWMHNESIWNPSEIHHESQVNAFHYTSLMSAFEKLGQPVDVGCCSGMRRLRSTEETDSLAKTFEHRRLDEAETGWWVERVSNRTELNWWMDWWIDVDIDGCVFFSHRIIPKKKHLDFNLNLKMTPKKSRFLKKQFPAIFPAHMTWWFQWSTSGRGGVFPVSVRSKVGG